MRHDRVVENTLVRFGIAFLIGALIGIEREKTLREEGQTAAAGLRTFILIALAGAISAWLSDATHGPWIFVAGVLVCAFLIVNGYHSQLKVAPHAIGLTTEFAAFVTFLLGGATLLDAPHLSVALAIAVSALLAYRRALHGAVERIGWRDIFAGLKLLIVAFIVLPVVPRHAVDPWGALNPYKMTWLVLLIAGLSFLGYVVTRWLGPKRGVAFTGVAGGLVSSTAVTVSLAKQSRQSGSAGAASALAAGILLSWAVMFVRVIVMCVVVNPGLARQVAFPMAGMALIAAGGAALSQRRSDRSAQAPGLDLENPFSLSFAIKFALLLAAIALLVNRAQALLSATAVYVVAALAGLTDVDAITLSVAGGSTPATTAVVAITVAVLSNTLTKTVIVWWVGKHALGARIFPVAGAIVVGAIVSIALFVL
jgi:uncharacterized membrane protein (DUF4010 family)